MLGEAVRSGFEIESLFVSADLLQPQKYEAFCAKAAIVPPAILAQISGIETVAPIVFVCKMPQVQEFVAAAQCVVLEDIRDPGNMGTIIRTADAFGIPLVLAGSCVDVFSPKVVRSTMGSIFRTKIMRADIDTVATQLRAKNIPLYAADLSEQAIDIRKCEMQLAAVIIGNEAAGVSQKARDCCEGDVIIPIRSAESLNAAIAAAIVMWQMQE